MASTIIARKQALVTGGTRGIGFAIAHKLAESGYDLVLGFNSNEERAALAKTELESKYGGRVFTVKGDIAEESTTDAFFESVQTNFNNKLNAFVHNAGLYVGKTTEVSSETMKNALEKPGVMAYGTGGLVDFGMYDYYQSAYPKCFVRCVERALPLMPDGDGYIVAISSPGCNSTSRALPGYVPGPAKAVMEYLVRCYALNLGPRRITCNCIIPGLVNTEAAQLAFGPKGIEAYAARSPMKTVLEPEDIGNAVGFLCSEKARFISGMAINVDGGKHLA